MEQIMKRIITTLLISIGVLVIAAGSAFGTTPAGDPTAAAVASNAITGMAKVIMLQGAQVDGHPLTYAIVGSPSHGTLSRTSGVTFTSAGALLYTSNPGYTGTDTFTYTVSANDSGGTPRTTSPATVTITVVNTRTTISGQLAGVSGGKISFVLSGTALTYDGVLSAGASVTANVASDGTYSVSLWPTAGMNPQAFWNAQYKSSDGSYVANFGPYNVPVSSSPISQAALESNRVASTSQGQPITIANETAVEMLRNSANFSAGSDTQIIYNSGGSLTGSPNLTYDGTTRNLNGADSINAIAVSSELAGSWTNSACAGFSTLTPSGTAITTAVTGSGAGLAYQSVALTSGSTYRVTFTLSSPNASLLRFGSFAFDCMGGDQLGGLSGPLAMVGINSITFTSSRTATDLIGFWHNGGDASVTFSVSSFSVKQIASGTDTLTAGGAITSYETITGKMLTTDHGVITNPVSFLKTELFGAGIVVAKDAPSGDTSNGAQQSVALGYGATVKMSGATAIGTNASAQNNSQADNSGFTGSPYGGYPTIIGFNAGINSHGLGTSLGSYTETGTNESVAIGPSSMALSLAEFSLGDHAEARGAGNEIVIGDAIVATGNGVIALGGGGRFTNDSVISLGYNSQLGQTVANSGSFANQQVLIGGSADGSTFGIKDVWLGNGDVGAHHAWQNTTPFSVTIHSTEGVGTNVSGGDLGLSSGHGTGNATGSKITFKTPVTTTSGSGNQSLVTGLTITVGTAQLSSYTVSGLPSASTAGAGAMAFVTDAASTTAYTTVAGGGSNKVLVVSDGTSWIIH